MFTKKQQTADVIKKSSAKVQDPKKDVFARLKHLKTILGKKSIISYQEYVIEDKICSSFQQALKENVNFA